jgi:hypothetical protein
VCAVVMATVARQQQQCSVELWCVCRFTVREFEYNEEAMAAGKNEYRSKAGVCILQDQHRLCGLGEEIDTRVTFQS